MTKIDDLDKSDLEYFENKIKQYSKGNNLRVRAEKQLALFKMTLEIKYKTKLC